MFSNCERSLWGFTTGDTALAVGCSSSLAREFLLRGGGGGGSFLVFFFVNALGEPDTIFSCRWMRFSFLSSSSLLKSKSCRIPGSVKQGFQMTNNVLPWMSLRLCDLEIQSQYEAILVDQQLANQPTSDAKSWGKMKIWGNAAGSIRELPVAQLPAWETDGRRAEEFELTTQT